MFAPFVHMNCGGKKDEDLDREARKYLADMPSLRFMARLLDKLRRNSYPFWTAESRYLAYPTERRMIDLDQRPEIRAGITTRMTGMAEVATRDMHPQEQAWMMDKMIKSGGRSKEELESEFTPELMAVYFDMPKVWSDFTHAFPWESTLSGPKDLVAACLEWFLQEGVLGPWELRTAVDNRIWHSRLPIDVHMATAKLRLEMERHNQEHAGQPPRIFSSHDELMLATPEILTRNIPLKLLQPIFEKAEGKMGFTYESEEDPLKELPSPSKELTGVPEPKLLTAAAPSEPIKITPRVMEKPTGSTPPKPSGQPEVDAGWDEVEVDVAVVEDKELEEIPPTAEEQTGVRRKIPPSLPKLPTSKGPPPLPKSQAPRPNGQKPGTNGFRAA